MQLQKGSERFNISELLKWLRAGKILPVCFNSQYLPSGALSPTQVTDNVTNTRWLFQKSRSLMCPRWQFGSPQPELGKHRKDALQHLPCRTCSWASCNGLLALCCSSGHPTDWVEIMNQAEFAWADICGCVTTPVYRNNTAEAVFTSVIGRTASHWCIIAFSIILKWLVMHTNQHKEERLYGPTGLAGSSTSQSSPVYSKCPRDKNLGKTVTNMENMSLYQMHFQYVQLLQCVYQSFVRIFQRLRI